ncbi:putative serine/threonine-protein kinase PRKY [Babylonia areolata]|uniref:putative serine/threonine-protein kinase PRKY n=1 Tax=Babylonia areolata TaxID=304850 RepID=UPI003FD57954
MSCFVPACLASSHVENNDKADRPMNLAGFKPLKVLGEGSYGKVVLMFDETADLYFAVKLVSVRPDPSYETQYIDIMKERDILKKLSGDPFFPTLYFTTKTEDYAWFGLEFYPGGTLNDLIKNIVRAEAKISFGQAQYIVAEIIMAVWKLHKKHILHNDIKPDNFLIDSRGHLVLTDFGMSVLMDKRKRLEEQVCWMKYETGTEYTAPEMLDDDVPHSYPSDLYSVGRTIQRVCNKNYMDDSWDRKTKRDIRHVQRLLIKPDPGQRATIKSISKHRFFRGVRWKDVSRKKVDMMKPHPQVDFLKPEQPCADSVLGSLEKSSAVDQLLEDFSTKLKLNKRNSVCLSY